MKISLVIIYNHNFEANVPVLNRVYSGRFSHVWHVMPFYRGSDDNVIGVYENSYYFGGYVSQALHRFETNDVSHYLFVPDDMILNPRLNEGNLLQNLSMADGDAFISNFKLMNDEHLMNWWAALPSLMGLLVRSNSCEWRGHLPSEERAREMFQGMGMNCADGVSVRLFEVARRTCRFLATGKCQIPPPFSLLKRFYRFFSSKEKTYPLAWGYSDVFMVPQRTIRDFCHCVGVLSAARVFVEAAIPTALVLTQKRIATLADVGFKAENGVDDYRVRAKLEAETDMDYGEFAKKFPVDYLYIHPVKLSKWRNLP